MCEEQHVVRDEPGLGPHFRGEEIRRRKYVHVRADELLTTSWSFGAPARARCHAVSRRCRRSCRSLDTRGFPSLRNPIVAPRAIFRCDAYNQLLISSSTRGRLDTRRFLEPSNFLATSLRCHPRIVSGLTMLATSSSARLPSCFPTQPEFAARRRSGANGPGADFELPDSRQRGTHSAGATPDQPIP